MKNARIRALTMMVSLATFLLSSGAGFNVRR
jgi:hypothetical protein